MKAETDREEDRVARFEGDAEEPRISVIICTLNRAQLLTHSVLSVHHQARVARADYELIVVDNGSTDETREVIEDLGKSVGNLRYVVEGHQGLSNARNAGIGIARGEVVAFLDDDAQASPGWLEAIEEALLADDTMFAVGGPVRLRWPAREAPEWLPQELEGYFGRLDYGETPRLLQYPEHPWGLNMAFRRSVFSRVGAFDPAFGRRGSGLLSGEESDLFRRMNAAGLSVAYEPRALVVHSVLPERVSVRWVLRRALSSGRTRARFAEREGPKSRPEKMRRAVESLWRALFRGKGTLARGIVLRDRQKLVLAAAHTAIWIAAAKEYAQMAIAK